MGVIDYILGSPNDVKTLNYIPHELLVAIENASVFIRSSQNETGEKYVIVSVANLGHWTFDGVQHTSDRISRAYPELNRRSCTKAAKLISAVVKRNRPNKRKRYRTQSQYDLRYNFDEQWRL